MAIRVGNSMNIAVIQARMGSTRLPGKVLMNIQGRPLLEIIVNRVRKSKVVDKVVVATSVNSLDGPISDFCDANSIEVVRGSEEDVLSRYSMAATRFAASSILRVTADCPMIDAELVSELFYFYLENNLDHAGLLTGAGATLSKLPKYPDGTDCEWISAPALHKSQQLATSKIDREHVTSFIWRNPGIFLSKGMPAEMDFSDTRMTIDTFADLDTLKRFLSSIPHDLEKSNYVEYASWIREQRTKLLSQDNIGKENYGIFYD